MKHSSNLPDVSMQTVTHLSTSSCICGDVSDSDRPASVSGFLLFFLLHCEQLLTHCITSVFMVFQKYLSEIRCYQVKDQ